ncbi:MAG: hypothetical protein K2G90_05315, partial [Muribaculaceae bacterium]|nr:hypothetical protein [Muribaculaceae bacterium]
IPFKPLQRGSLYYHTEFKPSPYPKLLHENEREYVLRAFDDAMTYSANIDRFEDGINPDAEARITPGRIFRDVAVRMKGGNVVNILYSAALDRIELTLMSSGDAPESIKFNFAGIIRANWDYTKCEHVISAIRLNLEDTYLLTNIDGADIEILSTTLRID